MTSVPLARLLSPEWRTAAYYFATFTSSGAGVAYAGIWFTEQGLSPSDIGAINALPVLLMLGLNLFVGRLADRASDWRQVIVAGAMLSAAIPFGLFFAHGFWGILLVWTCGTLPVAAIGPVVDAATLRMSRRNGKDFGTIRAWGTVGYMLANALTGLIVSLLTSMIFVPLYVFLSVLRGGFSLALPRFRAPAQQAIVTA